MSGSGSGSKRLLAALARGGLYAASNVAVVAAESVVGTLFIVGTQWRQYPITFKEEWQRTGWRGKMQLLNKTGTEALKINAVVTAVSFHMGCVSALQKAVQHYAGLH